MAMKKADMEQCSVEYNGRMQAAQNAVSNGLFKSAVNLALEACPYIDGMMQYARKYEAQEFDSVSAFDLVLAYAPLLLDSKSLTKIAEVLDEYRRIERNTGDDLGEMLRAAHDCVWMNHRLWNHLEAHPDCRQDELGQTLGGEQNHWRYVVESWEHMGLVQRTPENNSHRLSLRTRLGQPVPAKCSDCGSQIVAPKAMLLEPVRCPQCGANSCFVLLTSESSTGNP